MKARSLAHIALAGMLAACQAAPPPASNAVPFTVVHTSATCGTEETSVRPIGDAMRLKQVLEGSGNLIGSTPSAHADFDGSLVLRASMGQQPSAGAQFGVASVRTAAAGQQLVMHMLWAPPDPQRLHAAVITRPCVIVQVPAGDYRSVTLVDPQGRERATTVLPQRR